MLNFMHISKFNEVELISQNEICKTHQTWVGVKPCPGAVSFSQGSCHEGNIIGQTSIVFSTSYVESGLFN